MSQGPVAVHTTLSSSQTLDKCAAIFSPVPNRDARFLRSVRLSRSGLRCAVSHFTRSRTSRGVALQSARNVVCLLWTTTVSVPAADGHMSRCRLAVGVWYQYRYRIVISTSQETVAGGGGGGGVEVISRLRQS